MGLRRNFPRRNALAAKGKFSFGYPASASTSPCAKGNAARVGSSGPHALFIMIFSGFFASSLFAPIERKGKPASCAKKFRLAIHSLLHPLFPAYRGTTLLFFS